MKNAGVIAVVRGTKEEALAASEAIIKGGIKSIELTFTVPEVDQLIRLHSLYEKQTDIVIGAGTVVDAVTARIAIMAGAESLS